MSASLLGGTTPPVPRGLGNSHLLTVDLSLSVTVAAASMLPQMSRTNVFAGSQYCFMTTECALNAFLSIHNVHILQVLFHTHVSILHTEEGNMDSDWFKTRLKSKGLYQHDLAEVIGRDRSVVSRMLSGLIPIPLDRVSPIACLLEASEEEVLKAAGLELKSSKERDLPNGHYRLPVSHFAQANVFSENNAVKTKSPKEAIIRLKESALSEHVFLVEVRGNSMKKADLVDGDIAICLPIEHYPSDLKEGDRLLIRVADGYGNFETSFRELRISEDGRKYLWHCSDEPEFAKPDLFPSTSVSGLVDGEAQKGHVSIDSFCLGRLDRPLGFD